jgi:hypothetical protein
MVWTCGVDDSRGLPKRMLHIKCRENDQEQDLEPDV